MDSDILVIVSVAANILLLCIIVTLCVIVIKMCMSRKKQRIITVEPKAKLVSTEPVTVEKIEEPDCNEDIEEAKSAQDQIDNLFELIDEDIIRHMLNTLTGVYAIFVDKGTTPLMRRAWEKFKSDDFPNYKEIIKISTV